jgi:inosine-uridine nucleoside N-ribohydrolase
MPRYGFGIMGPLASSRAILAARFLVATVTVGIISSSGVYAATASQSSSAKAQVAVDSDMAPDDWMAILYLLEKPDVDVIAITVDGDGEAHCGPGVRTAMKLTALAGKPGIPVACGRQRPLKGNAAFPGSWRTGVDAMLGLKLPANSGVPSQLGAPQLLQKVIDGSPQMVTLVTLGPLTNIADLLRADPTAESHVAMTFVMGGAINTPGNLNGATRPVNTAAEWNMFIDPVADDAVFRSGLPITLVALDATKDAPITAAFYTKLSMQSKTPVSKFIVAMMKSQLGFLKSGNWYFWDPLAAVAATDASVITTEKMAISVNLVPGKGLGRTVQDSAGSSVLVAVGANAARFEQVFLSALSETQD